MERASFRVPSCESARMAFARGLTFPRCGHRGQASAGIVPDFVQKTQPSPFEDPRHRPVVTFPGRICGNPVAPKRVWTDVQHDDERRSRRYPAIEWRSCAVRGTERALESAAQHAG